MVVNHIIVKELFGGKKRNKINNDELVETFVTVFLDGIKSKIDQRRKMRFLQKEE